MKKKIKKLYLQKRKRIFNKILGTNLKPRLSIFKSNKHLYAQIINDSIGHTLASYNTLMLKKEINLDEFKKNSSISAFYLTGQKLAIKAKKESIQKIVFDLGNNRYHGNIKELAEGARKEGLIF
jgi:large subunit ribosomal protein L18